MTDPAVRFRELFEAHFAYVWGALRRLGVADADAEDLTHEVFLHVHRKLADYQSDRPIKPWLFGFVYYVAARHHRTKGRRREIFGVDADAVDPAQPADEQVADGERRSILWEALDALDLDRRAVLVMHEWDGEPMPEVARALEIPLNTAYSRLRLARADLAASVRRITARKGSP